MLLGAGEHVSRGAFDAREHNDLTWGDGTDATITHTYNVVGTNDPTFAYADDSVTVTNAATFSVEDLTLGTSGANISAASGVVTILGQGAGFDENLTIDLDGTQNTAVIGTGTGVSQFEFGTMQVNMGNVDLSEGNITNVGQINLDIVDNDGPSITIGDNDETIIINSSDWDIDATGIITNAVFDGGGTGNDLLIRSSADCDGLTDGVADEPCYDTTSDSIWMCEPTAGGCDTAGEWIEPAVVEIPNGAAPVANDPGELAHDTTDNQMILDDIVIPTRQFKCGHIQDVVAADEVAIWLTDDALTITQGWCRSFDATTVEATLVFSDGIAGTDMTGTVTCQKEADAVSKQAITGTNTLVAFEELVVDITNSPTATQDLLVCFEFTTTRE